MKDQLLKSILKNRSPLGNKGTFGNTLIYAGSKNYLGAAYLACKAALMGGSGYVSLCYDEPVFASDLPEVIYQNRSDLKNMNLNKVTAILFGNGLDYPNKKIQQDLNYLLLNYRKKLLIDATGLKYFKEFLRSYSPSYIVPQVIITPHIKEFCELFDYGLDGSDVLNYEKYIDEILKKFTRMTIVLKSYHTLIKNNDGRYLLEVTNSGLAKAGSGDTLSGLLVSFLAYFDSSILNTCYAGNIVFSLAGLRLKKKISPASFQAQKVAEEIPYILKKYIH